jgi:hypothetical protein
MDRLIEPFDWIIIDKHAYSAVGGHQCLGVTEPRNNKW